MTILPAETLPAFADPSTLPELDPDDAALALDHASAAIRAFCGWHVAPEVSAILVLDGTGTTILPLPSLHVSDVTAVSVGGVAETGFEWSAKGDLRRGRCGVWPDRYRAVEVTIRHGYEPIPKAIEAATVAVARRSSANPRGLQSETIASYSVAYNSMRVETGSAPAIAVGPDLIWLLGPYRITNAP